MIEGGKGTVFEDPFMMLVSSFDIGCNATCNHSYVCPQAALGLLRQSNMLSFQHAQGGINLRLRYKVHSKVVLGIDGHEDPTVSCIQERRE